MSLIVVNGTSLVVSGRILKIGAIEDEYWLERSSVGDPDQVIRNIRDSRAKIDLFTFSQKLPETAPKYPYYMEWDNVAALSIKTYDYWWNSQVNDKTRNMVRKAKKKGVEVRITDFNDALVKGITSIYNETPIRQGRRFWHYGKDIDRVKSENSTFSERRDFIGAYLGDQLIGFIKLVYTDEVAGMMQILSMIKDRDKATNNALLAKAVEICAEKGIRYLTYAKFTYGKKGTDPVAEFKHHNGFEKIEIPKYYVPLSARGRVMLRLGLHRELTELLPQGFSSSLRKIRTDWYLRKVTRQPESPR